MNSHSSSNDRQESYLQEMPESARQVHNMVACGSDTLVLQTIFYPVPSELETKSVMKPHTN